MRRTTHLFPGLGSRLRELRTTVGATQQELAAAAGCSKAFLSLVEQGRARPSVARLDRIAAHLGVDPNELRRVAGYDVENGAVSRLGDPVR